MSYGGNMQSYGDMTQGQPNPKTEYDYIVEELAPQTAPEILGPLKGIEGLLRTADRTPDKIGSNLGMSLLAYAFPWLSVDAHRAIKDHRMDKTLSGLGGRNFFNSWGDQVAWEGEILSKYPPSQYPEYEYNPPDGDGYSFDPNNPHNY